MDAPRFDRLTRSFTNPASRRGLLAGIAASLGLAALRFPVSMEAKKKRKNTNKKKPPAFNQFGCLNVGQKCRGNSASCCSGICQGKKPKKGEKDKSRCVAHDEGDCRAEQDFCADPLKSVCPADSQGFCFRTTGNASFRGGGTLNCAACTKDADCPALGFGDGACVVCSSCPGGIACVNRDN